MRSIYLGYEKDLERVWRTLRPVLRTEAALTDSPTREQILSDEYTDAEYIFSTWGMPTFTVEEIRTHLPCLRAVFYAAGSVRYFAAPFIEAGVAVFSAWAANAIPVAEYAVSQIILANKGFYLTSRLMQGQRLSDAAALRDSMPGNYHTKVGLIGVGMIGSLVAEKLHAITDLDVLAYDAFLSDERAESLGVKKVPLPVLFSECQTISNHLADNEHTRGMLNYDVLSLMRENAVLINTGRGAQIVEEDLTRLLTERPDITAVLDVTRPEPPVPDSPFYTLPNVVLTPHIAGSNGEEVGRMAEYMYREFLAFRDGAPTRYRVTADMLKTMA